MAQSKKHDVRKALAADLERLLKPVQTKAGKPVGCKIDIPRSMKYSQSVKLGGGGQLPTQRQKSNQKEKSRDVEKMWGDLTGALLEELNRDTSPRTADAIAVTMKKTSQKDTIARLLRRFNSDRWVKRSREYGKIYYVLDPQYIKLHH